MEDADLVDSTRLDIVGLGRTRVDLPRLNKRPLGEPRTGEPRTDGDRRGGSGHGPSGPSGPPRGGRRPGGSMRKPALVVGALAAVLVLAVGAVAFAAKGSSSGNPQAATAAKATAGISTSASASASKSTAKASAKATTKPSAKPSATKSTPTRAAPTKPPAAAPLSVPAGWTETLDAGFSGSTLDSSLWTTCYYWATSTAAGCTNNPSTEKEWYLPSQVQVSNGVLNLVAKQETTAGLNSSTDAAENYTCRSGMVSSAPGFNFTYGLITVTAKVPYGAGLWPALWLAASNHDWPPELDIMEHWHSESDAKVYDHTVGTKYLGGVVPTPGDLPDGFHTFSLLWTKSSVTWYIDGTSVYSTTSYVPQQSMYFIANVADDSTASGACDGTMQIQSVKVWQPS